MSAMSAAMSITPAVGDPENGVAPGTPWEEVPEDFALCPLCAVGKDQFSPEA